MARAIPSASASDADYPLCFHLGETGKQHEGKPPFAMLATVITGRADNGKDQHTALSRLLGEGSGHPAFAPLMALLDRLGTQEAFWRDIHRRSPVWKPQYLSGEEAYRLLATTETLAGLGITLKLPAAWQGRRPRKVQLSIQVQAPSETDGEAKQPWLRFQPRILRPDGRVIADIEELPDQDGLVRLSGKWVMVSRKRLTELTEHWQQLIAIQRQGVPLTTALNWLARWSASRDTEALGLEDGPMSCADDSQRDVTIDLGPALLPRLRPLLNPSEAALPPAAESALAEDFQATLRPYQRVGVAWLYQLIHNGLGGVLADDMGLGKTVQILALLTIIRRQQPSAPCLLIVPTSLLGNWQREAATFAPALKLSVCHPSCASPDLAPKKLFEHADIVLTTYGIVKNRPEFSEPSWQLVVCDEAQALKNPGTAVHQGVQRLLGGPRILLTGTPIENSLSDLWALMDTCCRPLLGTWPQFQGRLGELTEDPQPVKTLIKPFLLRRMKTDATICAELPAKIYRDVYCPLSPVQTALYREELNHWHAFAAEQNSDCDELAKTEPQERGGHILTTLLHLRQICNHPAQLKKDDQYRVADSGKFYRLVELGQSIKAQNEKMLVFTAYRELTAELAALLAKVFGREGFVLHGGTAPGERSRMVAAFQRPDGPPFFVLSLKAGGSGLTLTEASHVVHFDRWWNPAIENQATDRAYRIGQKKRVVVHRFICPGTVEERLGSLVAAKQHLADDVIAGLGQLALDALSDDELLTAFQLGGSAPTLTYEDTP